MLPADVSPYADLDLLAMPQRPCSHLFHSAGGACWRHQRRMALLMLVRGGTCLEGSAMAAGEDGWRSVRDMLPDRFSKLLLQGNAPCFAPACMSLRNMLRITLCCCLPLRSCRCAVWDACSLGANGLVFFWSGCACLNYLIRQAIWGMSSTMRGIGRGVWVLTRLPKSWEPGCLPQTGEPSAPFPRLQEWRHADWVCLVLGRHPHNLCGPGGPAHRQLRPVQRHRLPLAQGG